MPWLPRWVARFRATVQSKLLAAFLLIALLLLSAASVALMALSEMNQRAQETVQLQRKIAAYRQLSNDVIAQLYGVSTALLEPEPRKLEATLRQLKQFDYDIDRLQFLGQDEIGAMTGVRAAFDQFIDVVGRSVELIRSGKTADGLHLQSTVAAPLADRLERLTNELVNKAEADLVDGIQQANGAFARSRRTVIVCALVSIGLALTLGYALSASLVEPVKRIEAGMRQIGAGDFSNDVNVHNRDELGELAGGLNRMSAELSRLYAQLDAAREHAERANRDKSRFLAAASHDLRQPMHALGMWVGNLRVAQHTGNAAAAERAMQTIEGACKSLNASFNAILDLSRFDAGGIRAVIEVHSVSGLLEQIHAEFEPLAAQKGLGFRLRLSRKGPLLAQTDIIMLGRVLRNLVTNAIKYTNNGGVVIGEIAHAREVELRVFDSGVGIDEVHQKHMFTEFSHADRPGDQRSGLGLGLAIVRRSIDMLAGHRIDFFSRVGSGTRFRIRMPRAPGAARLPAMTDRSSRPARIPGAYIVVVDDEPNVLLGLTELLVNWGCFVAGGKSGSAALHAVGENERVPDLLITDLKLANGETGIDVARMLHDSLGVRIPVLLLSGDLTTQIELDDGQTPLTLLHKPIMENALREVLEDILPARRFI